LRLVDGNVHRKLRLRDARDTKQKCCHEQPARAGRNLAGEYFKILMMRSPIMSASAMPTVIVAAGRPNGRAAPASLYKRLRINTRFQQSFRHDLSQHNSARLPDTAHYKPYSRDETTTAMKMNS